MPDTQQDAIHHLRQTLPAGFLAHLTEAARVCGWDCDFICVRDFIEWVANEVYGLDYDKSRPMIEPYDFLDRDV